MTNLFIIFCILFYFSIINGIEIKDQYDTNFNFTNKKIDLNQILPKITDSFISKTNFTNKLASISSNLTVIQSLINSTENKSSLNLTEKCEGKNCNLNENLNGKKRYKKNRTKLRKKNRSLNPNGVITLNLNDFDMSDDDLIDLDRLSHRMNGRLSNKVKNSQVIVITGDEEDDNYETNNESYEGEIVNEQTEDYTNENDKLNEKKNAVELPCNKKKDGFDRINSSDKEIIVRNLTEVHNHINNTIINILPDKTNRNNYLSPKEKINEKNIIQKHENNNDQSHEIDNESTGGRRIIKNVTTIIEEGESNSNHQNQLPDLKKQYTSSTTSSPVYESNNENASGGRRVIKNVTTIIEESESNSNHQNQLPDLKKQYASSTTSSPVYESNNENASGGRRVIKNVTTIIEESESNSNHQNQLPDLKKQYASSTTSSPVYESNNENASGGRRIIKNVTTIIEESESDSNHQNQLPDLKKQYASSTTSSPVYESNNENASGGRRVIKNVTTIIEESESNSNHQNQLPDLKKQYASSTTSSPVYESNNENASGGRRVIKNVTTIIEESESDSNHQNQLADLKKQYASSTTSSPVYESNNENASGGRRIIKNVTTIIEEGEFGRDHVNKNLEENDTLEHINQGRKPSESKNLVEESSNENGKRRVVKNVTTIIEESESNSNHQNQLPDLKKQYASSTPSPSNESGSKRIIKNVTTTIIEEDDKRTENKYLEHNNKDANSNDSNPENNKDLIGNIRVTKNNTSINENKRNDDLDSLNNDQFHDKRIVFKNTTTIITTDEEETNKKNQINKNLVENEHKNQEEKTNESKNHVDDYNNEGGRRRIVKNITTIITEESNQTDKHINNFDDKKSSNKDINQSIRPDTNNNLNNNHSSSGRIIKNVTTTITTEEESNGKKGNEDKNIIKPFEDDINNDKKDQSESNKDSNDLSTNGSNSINADNGKRVINTTIITEENSNNDKENINDKKEFFELPCYKENKNLKPIAKIIETHHIVKVLFGSSLNGSSFINSINNNTFTRFIKKNVTKVINPNSLDDATSILIRNDSYLVKEIHEIEEKFILSPHSTNTDRLTNNSNIDIVNPKYSTIDPHGPISSTPLPPSVGSNNNSLNENYLTSTQRPTYIDDNINGEFNGEPQGIYLDETGDCKFEGFHRFEFDCRRFYLCRFDELGRFTIEEFLCVKNQVFNLERKVCVYENDYNCVIDNLNGRSVSNSTEIKNKNLNKILLEKDLDPIIIPNPLGPQIHKLIPKPENLNTNKPNSEELYLSSSSKPEHYSANNKNSGSNLDPIILSNSLGPQIHKLIPKPENLNTNKPNSEELYLSSASKPEHYSANNINSGSNLLVRVRPIISMNKFNQVQQEKGQFQSSFINKNHQFISNAPPPPYYFNSLPADPILNFERNYPPLIRYNNYPLIKK